MDFFARNPVGNFAVYPNPVKGGSFFIAFDKAGEGEAHVSVYDLLGRKVLETEKTFGPDKRMEIEVANLNAGAYLVEVEQNGKSFVQKLIVE